MENQSLAVWKPISYLVAKIFVKKRSEVRNYFRVLLTDVGYDLAVSHQRNFIFKLCMDHPDTTVFSEDDFKARIQRINLIELETIQTQSFRLWNSVDFIKIDIIPIRCTKSKFWAKLL